MHVVVRSRIFLARHRLVYWSIVLAIAAGTALLVEGRIGALDEQRSRWAETRSVLVATEDLVPDGPIAADTIDLPLVAVPPAAIEAIPPRAALRQRVMAGEVLVTADLISGAGPALHADRGTVVVGMRDPLSPGAAVGQRVWVASEGVTVAPDAMVVGVVDDVIFVSVAERDGPAVAAAARAGLASILFVP